MSLIEEALRRAEKDKAESIAARSEPEPLSPAARERSTRTRLVLALGLCCIASVGVGVWQLLDRSPTAGRPLSPRRTAAAEATVDRASDATARAPALAGPAEAGRTPALTGTADPPAPRASEPSENASAGTPAYAAPLPAADPQAVRDAVDGMLAAVDGFLDAAAERMAKTASEPVRPAKPAAPREPEETAVAAEADDGPVDAPPERQRAAGADTYKLSGIVRGGGEAVAIINGYFVSIGQTVGDATVLDIGRHSVRLRAGDREFTIRM